MYPNVTPCPYVPKHVSSRRLILWVDIETTGVDPATALPLEIAAFVSTIEGAVVSDIRRWGWIYPTSWLGMLEAETNMHSAWIREQVSDTVTRPCVPNVDSDLFGLWADAHREADLMGKLGRLPLGGKNVHYDRAVLLRIAPLFSASLLSHRNVDTKVLSIMGVPEIPTTEGRSIEPAHRAKADVLTALSQYLRAREIVKKASSA